MSESVTVSVLRSTSYDFLGLLYACVKALQLNNLRADNFNKSFPPQEMVICATGPLQMTVLESVL